MPECKHVATVVDLGDDGRSEQLRSELASVCVGGTVQIIPGTIVLAQGQLTLTQNVTIRGLGPDANPTVIDAGHASRVLDVTEAQVGLFNLTLTGGTANGSGLEPNGGGIRNTSGILELTRVHVTDSTATNVGGGIQNVGTSAGTASLTLNESTVDANSAAAGGAGIANVARGGNADLVVNDSTVNNNTVTGTGLRPGGGILNSPTQPPVGGALSVTLNGTSVISSNNAPIGGGIFNFGDATTAVLTLNDSSVVSGNVAQGGGGIFNAEQNSGSAVLTLNDSSSVVANNATGISTFPAPPGQVAAGGGGVFNRGTMVLADTSSIANNTAAGNAGGVLNFAITGPASLTLQDNSSIVGNSALNGGGVYNNASGATRVASVTLQDNSTIVSNTASNQGGGAYNTQSAGGAASITLQGTSSIRENAANLSNSFSGGGIFNTPPAAVIKAPSSTVTSNQPNDCTNAICT